MEEEIRKLAIMEYVKEKQPPKEIYTRLNRSKRWFFKWLERYQTGDLECTKSIAGSLKLIPDKPPRKNER